MIPASLPATTTAAEAPIASTAPTYNACGAPPVLWRVTRDGAATLLVDTDLFSNQADWPNPDVAAALEGSGSPLRRHRAFGGDSDAPARDRITLPRKGVSGLLSVQTDRTTGDFLCSFFPTNHCPLLDESELASLRLSLASAESRFSQFLDIVPVGVVIRRFGGTFAYANQLALEHSGVTREQLLSGDRLPCLSEEQHARMRELDDEVMRSGRQLTAELNLPLGGRAVALLIIKAPIRASSGELTHVCTLAIDQTAQKEIEQGMRTLAARRGEYLQMQRQFISMVSHEFRTPLTVIKGTHDLLGRQLRQASEPLRENGERLLRLQGEAMDTFRTLVDQVLLLNRIEHLTSEASLKRIPIVPQLDALVQRLNEAMEVPRIRLSIPVDVAWEVDVDPTLFRAAVENLISNAIKYSPANTRVDVVLAREGDVWVVTVSDEGRGIPIDEQSNLFRPFFRASNSQGVSGSGLGLCIVRRAVEFHGAQVRFASAPGRGTSFTLRFPLPSVPDPHA